MSDAQLTQGSSPRGRGKHYLTLPARPVNGLIPARAGKTSGPPAFLAPSRAHPRAGGENAARGTREAGSGGSSPRGRGKRRLRRGRAKRHGLIPARAGKTRAHTLRSEPYRAHPRAGGENALSVRVAVGDEGSSPRGRGKHFLTCAFIERIGQILETLELAVSSGSYSLCDVYATDAPQDQVRNTGLALPSSRAAS